MRLTKACRNYQSRFRLYPQLACDPGSGLDQMGGVGSAHSPGGLERIAGLRVRQYGNDYFSLTLLKIITNLSIK